jgi:tRNA(Ile)-lysidine synthase
VPAADRPEDSTPDPAALLAPLAGRQGLVLAVSGGPDSTALMWLAARWAARPPVLVVSVDHGLRPEAAEEARLVAANAERLGLPCRLMRPAGMALHGNRQAAARAARYDCLVAAAREAGCDTIVTAHHRDDQAETLLLRLARGSGIYGLAAMAPEVEIDGIRLARPLLGVSGGALKAVAEASGLPLVHDPSNLEPRYDRVRMRALMPALTAEGLTAERLAETAERLRSAAQALDGLATAVLAEEVAVDELGVARGRIDALREVHPEIGRRALARLLQAVGGTAYTPRFDRLQSLFAFLAEARKRPEPTRRTLNNVLLTVRGAAFTAEREWGRGLPRQPLPPGGLVWDGRFRLEADGDDDLEVGPLAAAGHPALGGQARPGLPALPALFRGGDLVAVPEIDELPTTIPDAATFPVWCLVAHRLQDPRAIGGLAPADPND